MCAFAAPFINQHTYPPFFPCLGQKPQLDAERPGDGSRRAGMHTHSITPSGRRCGLFQGAPGKRWLPTRSHPAARAWSRQEPLGFSLAQRPDLAAQPDRAAACPRPLHPSPPAHKPPASGTLIPTKLPHSACSKEPPEPSG